MKVVILYRPNSEYARGVEEYFREFERIYPDKKIEKVNVDTKDGAVMITLYDVPSHPALLALRDDGSALNIWQGENLPLMSEVVGYLNS